MNDQQNRAGTNNQERQPGVLVRFNFPITVGAVAAIAVIPFALVFNHYYANAALRDLIIFIAAASTGAATAVSAYYAAQSLIAGRADANEALKRETLRAEHATQKEKVTNAFDYMRRWNDPLFSRTKRQWRALLTQARKNPAETWAVLEADVNKRSAVQDVLNFFEIMGLAIKMEVVDEPTLKNYFKSVLLDYHTVFEGYIGRLRAAARDPSGYIEMQHLKERWSYDGAPKI